MDNRQSNVSSQEMLKSERYLWMARAFSVVAFLAIVANILLIVAVGSLYPLTRVQPFYLTVQDKNQQVIEIKKLSAEELNSDVLLESLIRQYILARYTIGSDLEELEYRWGTDGIVNLMSTDLTYASFYQNQAEELLAETKKQRLTLEVRILNVNKEQEMAQGRSIWRVEFETRQINQSSSTPEIKKWVARLQVSFNPTSLTRKMHWADRLKNPLGFTVEQYGFGTPEEMDTRRDG